MAALGIHQNPLNTIKFKPQRGCFSDHYEILDVISRGTYGIVYRARDKKTDEIVAAKEEIHGLCKATLTEIDFLKSLPRHPCVVEFKKVMMGKGSGVFVVMEYLEYDLHRYMDRRTKNPLTLMEFKWLMKEIIKGVSFLHRQGIMHRDLKPSNILFSTKDLVRVKICDFGLSAPFGSAKASYCPRVGTPSYRAPELVMGKWTYSSAVDMWAVGCIMAELVLGYKLFRATSKSEQLACIQRILNAPYALVYEMDVAAHQGKPALTLSGQDLLRRLLAYEPEKRITASDALDHPWFREISE